MIETRRSDLQITAGACFVVGLVLFLLDARSTGQALGNFRLIVSTSAVSFVGASVAVLAVLALVVLYFLGRKKGLKHS